jgi:hypothetical protein
MPLSEDGGIVLESSSGYLLAHDLVEHQNGPEAIGSVADELEALGGLWYTRGSWGYPYLSEQHRSEDLLRYELLNLFSDWLYKDWGSPIPKLGRQYLREEMEPIAASMSEEYFNELSSCALRVVPHRKKLVREFSKGSLRFLCSGAAKAHRRYGSQHTANNFFCLMVQAAKDILSEVEVPGQVFRLSYSFSNYRIKSIY